MAKGGKVDKIGKGKPNKESIINEMLIDLEAGHEREAILAKLVNKWQLSVRTLDRCLKIARERYQQRQESIQKELLKQSTEAAKERLKKAILTKDERMEIASKIAKGEGWKVGSNLIIPSGSDRMKALEYLSKVEGDFAPVKTDVQLNDFGSFLKATNTSD